MSKNKDWRVEFQYLDEDGEPHFEYGTVTADTAENAATTMESFHTDDLYFKVIQVDEANGVESGFTNSEKLAAKYIGEIRKLERRLRWGKK